jgi:butyryl-CoA dehydrogenase
MMLKRAQRGQLPLVEAVKKLQAELLAGPSLSSNGTESEDAKLVANAKKTGLLVLGIAYQRFLTAIEEQQEVMAGITDVLMNAFAMESVYLRTQKLGAKGTNGAAMSAVFIREAMEQIESAARTVIAACAEGDNLRTNLAVLKRFTKFEPVNSIELRRGIARRLLEAGKYVV